MFVLELWRLCDLGDDLPPTHYLFIFRYKLRPSVSSTLC